MNKDAVGKAVRYDVIEEFESRPAVVAYMTRAFLPSPGLQEGGALPRIAERWQKLRIDTHHLQSFISMTGLPAGTGISLLHSPVVRLVHGREEAPEYSRAMERRLA
jgi:hypothetical protein